jgi:S-adenosylmethionine/arginine decarboxylase-like enzyme
MYGKELILDIHNCDVSKFNRKDIEAYLVELCDEVIDMERADLHWWDYEDQPEEYDKAPAHLKGISCVQFIMTSNITIHTLDELGIIYLNIFSCKDFVADDVIDFTKGWFSGEVIKSTVVDRHKTDNVEIKEQNDYKFLWINGYLWMWDVPIERQSQKNIADAAYGEVLVAGYGLGLVQKYLLENPNVKLVVTTEKIPKVIKECKRVYGKIYGDVLIDDFFTYPEDNQFDCVIGDIWADVLPECLGEYKNFKDKANGLIKEGGKILAWGGDFFEYLIEKEKNL